MRLAARVLFFVLYLITVGDSLAQNLRDEARQKGYAWRSASSEDLFLATSDQLVMRSDLIVRGRVVAETVRLSPDGEYVLTDYTVEVLETIRDSGKIQIQGGRIVVSQQGGQLLFEGRPIRVDTQNPPLRWIQPHIFLITRSKDSYADFYLTSSQMGAFPIKGSKIVCETEEKKKSPVSGEFCDKSEAEFAQAIKTKVTRATTR